MRIIMSLALLCSLLVMCSAASAAMPAELVLYMSFDAGTVAGGEVEGGVHGKNRLMGNSLLDYNVFGRAAGISASEYAKKTKPGKLSLKHLEKYEKSLKDAGIKTKRRAPILLPEYRGKEALSRSIDIDKVVYA